jgi:hypothetical protein
VHGIYDVSCRWINVREIFTDFYDTSLELRGLPMGVTQIQLMLRRVNLDFKVSIFVNPSPLVGQGCFASISDSH